MFGWRGKVEGKVRGFFFYESKDLTIWGKRRRCQKSTGESDGDWLMREVDLIYTWNKVIG